MILTYLLTYTYLWTSRTNKGKNAAVLVTVNNHSHYHNCT